MAFIAAGAFRTVPKVNPIRLMASSSMFHKPPCFAAITDGKGVHNLTPARHSSSGAQHDHSRHWTAERIVTTGLLGLIPAALAYPSPPLDYALALTLVMHSHWGLEAIVVDYVRPSIFGETIPKVSLAALYALSMMTFGSLCYFNYADVGIAQAVRMIWSL